MAITVKHNKSLSHKGIEGCFFDIYNLIFFGSSLSLGLVLVLSDSKVFDKYSLRLVITRRAKRE